MHGQTAVRNQRFLLGMPTLLPQETLWALRCSSVGLSSLLLLNLTADVFRQAAKCYIHLGLFRNTRINLSNLNLSSEDGSVPDTDERARQY